MTSDSFGNLQLFSIKWSVVKLHGIKLVNRAFNKAWCLTENNQVFCCESPTKICAASNKGVIYSASYIAHQWVQHKGSTNTSYLIESPDIQNAFTCESSQSRDISY